MQKYPFLVKTLTYQNTMPNIHAGNGYPDSRRVLINTALLCSYHLRYHKLELQKPFLIIK